MVEAILFDKKQILPCAARLEGEYGVNGYYAGVPVKLGANGVEEIIELQLTADEQRQFSASAASVQNLVNQVRKLVG